ncbi:hypothetical protein BJP36_41140 [Moorena producens JHB]|uniref:Uncharacterized protein n=1 Tax=Moorena producens (strain JHB) TaxID=1454205 RepID=A0A9Q9SSF1_MOOP1|nr:hypothetical protein [Moorena producens]WAN68773.1 hypothetical protein BJP36_41140 [Moorena producens JHB]
MSNIPIPPCVLISLSPYLPISLSPYLPVPCSLFPIPFEQFRYPNLNAEQLTVNVIPHQWVKPLL